MLKRALIAGTVLAIASYLLISQNLHDERVFAGLLGLVAGASIGAVWVRETRADNARVAVIVAAVASIAAFFLADPLALGFRAVAAITGSFAATGALLLMQPRR